MSKLKVHHGPTRCRTFLSLAVCLLECFLFGGTIFGWSSLVYMLQADGIYANLCDLTAGNSTNTNDSSSGNGSLPFTFGSIKHEGLSSGCDAQAEQFSLAFTIGIAGLGLASFPAGVLFDKYGLLLTRLVCSGFAIFGYLLLIFISKGNSWMIFPGTVMIAISCIILSLTNSHVAQLAGTRTSFVMFLFNGAVNSSGAIFFVIKFCYGLGVPRVTTLSILLCLWTVFLINTLCILPFYKVLPTAESESDPTVDQDLTDIAESGSQKSISCITLSTFIDASQESEAASDISITPYDNSSIVHRHVNHVGGAQTDKDTMVVSELEKAIVKAAKMVMETATGTPVAFPNEGESRCQCVFSSLNVVFLLWFACLHVHIQVFLGTFNIRIAKVVDGNLDKVSHFTNMLAYAQMCSLLISPPVGLLMDWKRKMTIQQGLKGRQRAIAALPSTLLACATAFLLVAASLGNTENWLYVAIFASEILRSSLYPTGNAFLEITFPNKHYGVLFGLAYFVNGSAGMMQYPYTIWIQSYGFFPVDLIMLGTCLLTLVHPLHIVIRHLLFRAKEMHRIQLWASLLRNAQNTVIGRSSSPA